MSYDLYFADTSVGPSWTQRFAQEQPFDHNPTATAPLDKAEQARKQKLAADLIDTAPDLVIFQFDYKQLAHVTDITLAEAERRFRHLELNAPDGGTGLQVQIHDDWALVSLPYWHDGAAAAAVLAEWWTIVNRLAMSAGYGVWDRQRSCVIDPANDFAACEALYGELREESSLKMLSVATSGVRRPKPWWQFW